MGQLRVDRELRRAKAHERKGEWEQARARYESVLAAYPDNVRAREALSEFGRSRQSASNSAAQPNDIMGALINLYQQGRYSEADQKAKKLTKQHPNSFVLWNFLGLTRMALGQHADAIEGFNKAVALNPNFPDAHSNLGIALQEQGELDQALRSFQKAVDLKPKFACASA
ncbi:MAG: tetratricopeptide repeat protein [Pseudomonadota bacterium]